MKATSDLEAACHFVFDKAHWKWTVSGEAALSTGERTVIAVETFFGETCNGGLLQYLGNESGAFAADLPEALMRVGLMEYVQIALELRGLFPGGISRDPSERWDRVEMLAPEEDDLLDRLTNEFFEVHSRGGEDGFRSKLAAYIRANDTEFVYGSAPPPNSA